MSEATERHGLAMREAAADMRARHGDGHPRQAFWSALAQWLEGVWYRAAVDPDLDDEPNWQEWNAAIKITKAYQAASDAQPGGGAPSKDLLKWLRKGRDATREIAAYCEPEDGYDRGRLDGYAAAFDIVIQHISYISSGGAW